MLNHSVATPIPRGPTAPVTVRTARRRRGGFAADASVPGPTVVAVELTARRYFVALS